MEIEFVATTVNERKWIDFFSASLHKRLVQTEIQNEDLRRLLMLDPSDLKTLFAESGFSQAKNVCRFNRFNGLSQKKCVHFWYVMFCWSYHY